MPVGVHSFTIDAGNTRIKVGLFLNDRLIESSAFDRSLEGLNGKVLDALQRRARDHGPLVNGIFSSVSHLDQSLKVLLAAHFRLFTLDHTVRLPFRSDYETPETLGTDRMAVIAAAGYLYPGVACLVINTGTAITYDYLSENNVFQGGAISPGMEIRFRSLHTFTSRLPLIDSVTGTLPAFNSLNTADCIRSGVVLGILAEISGLAKEWQTRLASNQHVLISGGDSGVFVTQLKSSIFAVPIKWQPDLVLIGLNSILKFNDV